MSSSGFGHRVHARCACGSHLGSGEAFRAAGLARPFALPGTKRVYERARPFRVDHIALDLTLDFDAKRLAGVALLDVRRVDQAARELVLDGVGFDVARVALEPLGAGADAAAPGLGDVKFAYDGEELRVPFPPPLEAARVRVEYRAKPARGMYFLAPDEHVPSRPRQVWTQCQDEDARCIFPCHDKPHIKQTTEVRARVPAGYFVLSNGARLSAGDPAAEARGEFHYKFNEPHPSYLFTLVAGEFAILEDKAGEIPLTYLVPKDRAADGARTFARTKSMIQRFGELFGVPYPWASYAQVVVSDFIFGGMENTTATTMYEHILLDERAQLDITSDDLIAHELAHQWFGDLVTCRDWSHAWLNEGFATYLEHLDRQGHLGDDEYLFGLMGDLGTYLGEARGRYKRPVVCQDYEAPIDVFDRHLYEKGSLVLHMLRRELGDAAFFKGVGDYLRTHARGIVETRDLQRALEAASGKGLERFFDQWLFRAGHPEVSVEITYESPMLVVSIKQPATEQAPPFAFDLDLDVALDEGAVRRVTRRVDQGAHVFAVRVDERPKFVVVDPDFRIAGDVKIDAPADMLRRQLAAAPTARGRAMAAELLSGRVDLPTVEALSASLASDGEFWGVRAEAASALGRVRTDDALAALLANASVGHPKVRRAVAAALGKWRGPKAEPVLKKLALSDPSYLVSGEAARALGGTRQAVAFDTLVELLERPSWADVVRVGAVDGLAASRDDRSLAHVQTRTRYGVPTRVRRAAIAAVPKLTADRKARELLEDLLDDDNPHLRIDVVRALGELGDAKARPAIAKIADRDLDGRVRRRAREVLRDLAHAGKRDVERIQHELETVTREAAQLKARLDKLEAKAEGPGADGASSRDSSVNASAKTPAKRLPGVPMAAATEAKSSKPGKAGKRASVITPAPKLPKKERKS